MQKSLSADNPGLIVAQIRALELAVPLAVLTCVSKADLQNHAKAQALQKAESELANHNIPLIALIGRPEEVLPAAFHHLSPANTFNEQTPSQPSLTARLRTHPYSWPAKMFSIRELQTLDTTCHID